MAKIILATTSPYRQEVFKILGLDFVAEPSNVDERDANRPKMPEQLVLHLAKLKAESVAKNHKEGIVIGFDSVGFYEDKIFEKPLSRQEAQNRLRFLSGRLHNFSTGIHMIDTHSGKNLQRCITTRIRMREISDEEINHYLDEDPKYNTYALGYDPRKHYSCTFPLTIEGSYNNFLYGLPLEAIVQMLREFDHLS